MEKFANFVQNRLRDEGLNSGSEIKNLSKTDRYVMYKAGPVLSVNVSVILSQLCRVHLATVNH